MKAKYQNVQILKTIVDFFKLKEILQAPRTLDINCNKTDILHMLIFQVFTLQTMLFLRSRPGYYVSIGLFSLRVRYGIKQIIRYGYNSCPYHWDFSETWLYICCHSQMNN